MLFDHDEAWLTVWDTVTVPVYGKGQAQGKTDLHKP